MFRKPTPMPELAVLLRHSDDRGPARWLLTHTGMTRIRIISGVVTKVTP